MSYGRSASPGLLIWWSTNTRAASVLAQVAVDSDAPIGLVVDPETPPPSGAILRQAHVVERSTRPITPEELAATVQEFVRALGVDKLVLAPTSEYLLDTLHSWSSDLIPELVLPGTSSISYRHLSSKEYLSETLVRHHDLPIAQRIEGLSSERPFVAKPRVNIVNGHPLRPFIVNTLSEWEQFLRSHDAFFAQEYIPGPSIYWCGHRSREGSIAYYLQENLLQQEGGQSVSLAVHRDSSSFASVTSIMTSFLNEIEFVGPVMAEFRGLGNTLIEINPRFWGPLLLDATSGGGVIEAFFREYLNRTNVVMKNFPTSTVYAVPSLVESAVSVDRVFSITSKDSHEVQMTRAFAVQLAGWDPTQLGGAW